MVRVVPALVGSRGIRGRTRMVVRRVRRRDRRDLVDLVEHEKVSSGMNE